MEKRPQCSKCKDTGIIKDENGTHTCWDCLQAGRLDVHSKKLPDNNIKL